MIDEYNLLKSSEHLRYFEVPAFPSKSHQLDGKSYVVTRVSHGVFSPLKFIPELKLTRPVNRVVEVYVTHSDIFVHKLIDNSVRIRKYPILKELSKDEFDKLIVSAELSK